MKQAVCIVGEFTSLCWQCDRMIGRPKLFLSGGLGTRSVHWVYCLGIGASLPHWIVDRKWLPIQRAILALESAVWLVPEV